MIERLYQWWAHLPWSEALLILVLLIAWITWMGFCLLSILHAPKSGAAPRADHRTALYKERRRHFLHRWLQ